MTIASPIRPVPEWDLGQTWLTFANGTYHGVIAGVEIQKSDDDLQRYREAIETSQPDIIVETGTRAGGSALWFHREMGLQVVSIDVCPEFTKRGQPPHLGAGIDWIRGSSIANDVVEQVIPHLKGKRVMVSLDSDHHTAHVQAEIRLWSQFVTPGCYLVVEDACFDLFHLNGHTDWARVGGARIPEYGGPLDAIEKTLARPWFTTSAFWRDESLEAITPISHSPCGWWRREE